MHCKKLPVIVLLLFCNSIFAQNWYSPYPVVATLQIIPYGTNNNLTGPFVSAQIFTKTTVFELSIGESYNDIFGLNVVASNPVYGIKNYLNQAEAGVMIIRSVTERGEVGDFKRTIVKGLRIGAQYIASYDRKLFKGADTMLVSPSSNTTETYRYYPTAFINTNYTSAIIHIGYGRQAVLVNDIKDSKGRTRDFYADLLFAPTFLMNYQHVRADGTPFTGIAEQAYKNMLGFRIGYKWTSFSTFGGILGMEMGLRPGVYVVDPRYGPGTDIGALTNFYFAFKLGFSAGIIHK
jgi:hypothetical protein